MMLDAAIIHGDRFAFLLQVINTFIAELKLFEVRKACIILGEQFAAQLDRKD